MFVGFVNWSERLRTPYSQSLAGSDRSEGREEPILGASACMRRSLFAPCLTNKGIGLCFLLLLFLHLFSFVFLLFFFFFFFFLHLFSFVFLLLLLLLLLLLSPSFFFFVSIFFFFWVSKGAPARRRCRNRLPLASGSVVQTTLCKGHVGHVVLELLGMSTPKPLRRAVCSKVLHIGLATLYIYIHIYIYICACMHTFPVQFHGSSCKS